MKQDKVCPADRKMLRKGSPRDRPKQIRNRIPGGHCRSALRGTSRAVYMGRAGLGYQGCCRSGVRSISRALKNES